ncbi:hypothetical protein N2603_27915 [Bradyrhizobium huanghuaihaiense]|uniref:hypothetical protein n=1 Tax=Bradyrhizobium huanghuaihaiense TaxID=990078 RepID=UPI0021A97C5D|nr:hypothetical protein [Bradyrhizobium sp. CB3035]UWU73892.1 hypothetical protein N2603_27915 [Bradyrhizobium sp. CB3035]
MMRLMTSSLVLAACLVSPAVAEEQVNILPPIVVGSSTPKSAADGRSPVSSSGSRTPASPDRCVEVEIGSSRSMDCLNQKLRREVDRVNPSINLPPVDARSPDLKVGIVNIPGVQQQYGRNFGVSVAPYRPPVFSSPIGHR